MMKRFPLSCLAGAAIALTTFAASADVTKQQCVDADTNGQTLRQSGKLTEAREQFQICSDPKCPKLVNTDCTQRIDEVEAAFPGIIFDVKSSKGTDLSEVTITIDGKPLATKVDGTALRADPGSHEFKFTAAGEPDITQTFVLREGEKTRHEKISFAPEAPPPPPPPPPAEKPAPPPAGPINGDVMRLGGIVLAAGGVIGLGAGILYGAKAASAANDQKKDCTSLTNCRNHPQALSDHDAATTWGRFSTVGFIVGAVLIAGGAVLFFTAPENDQKTGQLTDPLRFAF